MAERKVFPTVRSPAGIAAFTYLYSPDSGGKYSDDKYKLTLIVDPEGTAQAEIDAIHKVCRKVAKEEFGNKVNLDDVRMPYQEGAEDKEEFAGKMILRTKSKFQPGIVDAKRKPLAEGVKVKSGDLIKCAGTLYPYAQTENIVEVINGKKVKKQVTSYGVSIQLIGVQLLEKRVGGGGDVSGLFDDEEGEIPAAESEEDYDTDGSDADLDI